MEIVYFELNNWFPRRDYPDAEPFNSWINTPTYTDAFEDNDWCIENKLCVVQTIIDMSLNYCVTATKEWVEANCPELLTKYTRFLRYPNPEYDNEVYGRFGCTFKEWSEENFGCEYVEEEE